MMFNCKTCSKVFKGFPSRKNSYCSRMCLWNSRIATKIRDFSCGVCGIVFSDSTKHKRKYCSLKCRYSREENNPNYKGDSVGYFGLHLRIIRRLGQPDTCEKCKKGGLSGKQIHWANKSGEYKHNTSDWMRLCKDCHQLYDFEKFGARKEIYA